MKINFEQSADAREFLVMLLDADPEIKIAPSDELDIATRDMAVVDGWRATGKKLVVVGVDMQNLGRTDRCGLGEPWGVEPAGKRSQAGDPRSSGWKART